MKQDVTKTVVSFLFVIVCLIVMRLPEIIQALK